jgi:hypothetical protein
MTCPNSKYDMSKSHVHISHVHFKFAYKRKKNIELEEKCKKSFFFTIFETKFSLPKFETKT